MASHELQRQHCSCMSEAIRASLAKDGWIGITISSFPGVEISAHRLKFAGHQAIVVVASDITERKRAQDAESRSAQQLCYLFHNLDEVIFLVDLVHPDQSRMSPACLKIYGYSLKRFLASHFCGAKLR